MSKKRVRTGSGSDRGIIASRQSSVVSAEFTRQPVSEPEAVATGAVEVAGQAGSEPPAVAGGLKRTLSYARTHLWLVAMIAFLSIGAIGAVLKYLDEDAQKQKLLAAKDRSALSALNPFLA